MLLSVAYLHADMPSLPIKWKILYNILVTVACSRDLSDRDDGHDVTVHSTHGIRSTTSSHGAESEAGASLGEAARH